MVRLVSAIALSLPLLLALAPAQAAEVKPAVVFDIGGKFDKS